MMRFFMGLTAMIGLASATISAGEFEKISLWGPYQVAMYPYYNDNQCIGDTAGYAPESYFGQMEELGLNAAITWGDSISTNNVHGIKIFSNTTGLIMYNGRDLDRYTGGGNYFISEVEQSTQSYQLGTWWDHGEGDLYSDGSVAGWFCDPHYHDSGTALQFPAWRPPKWAFRFPREYHTDVTMKVWNTATTDTICAITRRFSAAPWVCDTTWDYDSSPPVEHVDCFYST